MYDDEVSKLEMWLVVEEMREHQAMMAWGMVFGVVVPEAGAYGAPVNIEFNLTSAISDQAETHPGSDIFKCYAKSLPAEGWSVYFLCWNLAQLS